MANSTEPKTYRQAVTGSEARTAVVQLKSEA